MNVFKSIALICGETSNGVLGLAMLGIGLGLVPTSFSNINPYLPRIVKSVAVEAKAAIPGRARSSTAPPQSGACAPARSALARKGASHHDVKRPEKLPATWSNIETRTGSPSLAVSRPFAVGDKLRIVFYERIEVEEDKWGRVTTGLRGLQQRPELSGEYSVEEDGTIVLPLLGPVPVVDRSVQQVQRGISKSFEDSLGRKGLVSILSVERPPVYVLGPVKNPGSYKYVPGMTVLHAIALAGGLDRRASEPWEKMESIRAIEKRSGAADALPNLLARLAALKAERDSTEPKIPLRLIELVGTTEAEKLMNEQSERRNPIVTARQTRERSILSGVESAKLDVDVYSRMESLDELVKLRQDRVNSIRALVDRHVLSMTALNQVQTELMEAEQRRRDAVNQYALAKQRLASTEADALRVAAELKGNLEAEIEVIERQVAESEREFNNSEDVLSTLSRARTQFGSQIDEVTYQLVRQTAAGPISMKSMGMSPLQPGDLVNIIPGERKPQEQAGSPVPTRFPGESLSAGHAANLEETSRVISDHMIGPN